MIPADWQNKHFSNLVFALHIWELFINLYSPLKAWDYWVQKLKELVLGLFILIKKKTHNCDIF